MIGFYQLYNYTIQLIMLEKIDGVISKESKCLGEDYEYIFSFKYIKESL